MTYLSCIIFFLWISSSAFASIEFERIKFGFEGHFKRSRWVPLHVSVVSQDEATTFTGEIIVEVSDIFSGKQIQTYSTPLSLMPTDRQRRVLYIFHPGTSTKLNLKLTHQDGRIQTQREIVPELPKQAKDLFVLALTPNRDVLSRRDGKPIVRGHSGTEEGQTLVAYVEAQKFLPTHWKGYDTVELLVIRGVSLTERYISRKQQTAVLDWIQEGGTLIVSGGSDVQYLRGSFLEPLLPVNLGKLRTVAQLPASMHQFELEEDVLFNLIDFKPKEGSQILVGNRDNAYVVKRSFGSGQIICLAFDYNVSPFANLSGSEEFWSWLFETTGRSPRRLEARNNPHRRHHEKIHKLLTSMPSTHAPLIWFLSAFLSVYLLSFGGLTWWAGRHRRSGKRPYWMSGILLTMFFSCAILLLRHFLPSLILVHRFSILSVYPERERAYLQSYLGLIASAHSETSIQFNGGTVIKPLTPIATSPLHLVESKDYQLRQATLSPWRTSGYFAESFLDFSHPSFPLVERGDDDATEWIKHHLPDTLENAWLIDGEEYSYLGSIPTNTSAKIKKDFNSALVRPFPKELSGTRKQFAQILSSEVVLRYLMREEGAKLVGWLRKSFLPMELNHPVNAVDETFVILYLK